MQAPDLQLSLSSIAPLLTALQTITPEKSQEVCITPDGPNLRLSTTHTLLHASTILPATLFTSLSLVPHLRASVNHSLLLDTLSALPTASVTVTLADGVITATASEEGETVATVRTNDTPAMEVPPFGLVACSGYAPCAGLRDAVSEVEYCCAVEALVTMNDELTVESNVGEAGVRVVVDGFEGTGNGSGWFKVSALARVAKALSDGGTCRIAIDDNGALKVVAEVGEGVVEFVIVGLDM